MADRNSAEIFGNIFLLLAETPTDEYKELARKIYEMSMRYDFSECQMEADEACLALGIARMGIHPNYPEDGRMMLWPYDKGYREAKGNKSENQS